MNYSIIKKTSTSALMIGIISAVAFGAQRVPAPAPYTAPYNTTYEKPTVILDKTGNHVNVRYSSRGKLKVVTKFNSDGTKQSVQDNTGAVKMYAYDGKKHLKEIRRGTHDANGTFLENQAQRTIISYDMNFHSAVMSTGGVLSTVVFHPTAKKATNKLALLPPLLPRYSDGNGVAHLRTVQCNDPESVTCTTPPVVGSTDPSQFFSYYDAYTLGDLGSMTYNGQDFQVTSTITYGGALTPIQEFANEILDYLSTPSGQQAMAAVAVTTMIAQPEVAPFIFEAIASSGIFYETVATGLAATAVESVEANAAEMGETFQQAVQRGRDFQYSFAQYLGTGGSNTTAVNTTTTDGTAIRVIPDFIGVTIIEVKDVLTLAYTKQLQGMVNYAISQNKVFHLVVSTRTQKITGPLMRAVASTRGFISVYDDATGAVYDYTQP